MRLAGLGRLNQTCTSNLDGATVPLATVLMHAHLQRQRRLGTIELITTSILLRTNKRILFGWTRAPAVCIFGRLVVSTGVRTARHLQESFEYRLRHPSAPCPAFILVRSTFPPSNSPDHVHPA